MLVGVTPLSPSLIPTLWNIGILHYKQAKLHKDMQHSVYLLHSLVWHILFLHMGGLGRNQV